MEKGKFFKEKRFFIAIFLLIVAVGIFLRTFQYQENLLFEIDQARDWKNAKNAYDNGIGELSLLGPRAGGTLFRLGPITTYFHYVSMLVFGDGLAVPSYPDLLFSILTIPFCYLFAREYFSKRTSLVLMALFSVSLFAVEYSRFGWNPNSVPFFTLLTFYGILRFSREVSLRKRIMFLSMVSLGLGVLIQLHTISLVAVPAILLGYWALGSFKIRFKEGMAALAIFVALLSPILISEYSSGLANSKAFVAAFVDRGGSDFGMDKKILKGAYELSRNYYLILTSRNDFERLERTSSSPNALVVIKKNLNKTLDMALAFALLFFMGFSLYWIYREYRKIEGADSKKNFLLLFLVWNAVYAVLLIFLSEKQDSRHYLGLIFSPLILLGYYLEKLWTQRPKWRNALVFSVAILLIVNVLQSADWLKTVDGYNRNREVKNKEYILEPYFKVTLSQYREMADYIEGEHKENGGEVEIYASPYFERSIKHILNHERKVPTYTICNSCLDGNKNYYLIDDPKDLEERIVDLPEKVRENFEVASYRNFGTLTVFKLKIKEGKLNQ